MDVKFEHVGVATIFLLIGFIAMMGLARYSGVPYCSMFLNNCEGVPTAKIKELQAQIEKRNKKILELEGKVNKTLASLNTEQEKVKKSQEAMNKIFKDLTKINTQGLSHGEKIKLLVEKLKKTTAGIRSILVKS